MNAERPIMNLLKTYLLLQLILTLPSQTKPKLNPSSFVFVTKFRRISNTNQSFICCVVFILASVKTLISSFHSCFSEDSDIFISFIHSDGVLFIMSCSVGGMAVAMEISGANARSLDLSETELKLGPPGLAADESRTDQRNCSKRSFSQAMKTIDCTIPHEEADKINEPNLDKEKQMALHPANDAARTGLRPPPKSQIVGWPPVKDFRKVRTIAASNSLYVKVSMDGAPYLRKMDLKMYSTYHDLTSALQKMFNCLISMGKSGSTHELNESNLMDHVLNGSEYVPTYEDKDGDWMLVGDVPWQMFVDSCQRMRIVKASEAIGLAPRAMGKCKNRN